MTRYALVVGISEYQSLRSLSKPEFDAKTVAAVLEKYGKFKFVNVLTGDVPREKLSKALINLLKDQATNNEALIYFTGHGFTVVDDFNGEDGYLATSDCEIKYRDNGSIQDQHQALALSSLNKLIQTSTLSNLVVLFDCCHSGAFLKLVKQSFSVFGDRQDYLMVMACREFEEAVAKRVEPHSVFTNALLKGLAEDKANSQGDVTGGALFDFIYGELRGEKQEAIHLGIGRALTIVTYPPEKDAVQSKPEIDETICPYQGLKHFDQDRSHFFFGRKEVVESIRRSLNHHNFVAVVGASGSGKSSVVRAGLLPMLADEEGWQILDPIKPGDAPLLELRDTFKSIFKNSPKSLSQLNKLIREGQGSLQSLTEQLPGHSKYLLIVDQFEEIFTVCSNQEEQSRFIELIASISNISDSRLFVVITMRADFLESCLLYDSLTKLIQNQAIFIPPLTNDNLHEIIVKPAEVQQYKFEPKLLTDILQDVGGKSSILPLLQFSLTELWERRDRERHLLLQEHYNEMGRVAGALDRHAEKVYEYEEWKDISSTLLRSPLEKEWIKRIFLHLVRTNEGGKDTRKRQDRDALLSIINKDPNQRVELNNLLGNLIDSGLLVSASGVYENSTDGRNNPLGLARNVNTVELAHEVLIFGWKRFSGWLEESRHLRELRDKIEDAFQDWVKSSKKTEDLIAGSFLLQIQDSFSDLKPDLSQEIKDFIELSIRSKTKRFINSALSEINVLIALSRAQLSLNEQLISLMTALKASQKLTLIRQEIQEETFEEIEDSLEEVEKQLTDVLRQVVSGIQERNCFHGHNQKVEDVIFSDTGKLVISAGADKSVKIWQFSGQLLKSLEGHSGWVNSISLSPESGGKFLIASASSDKLIKLWQVQSDEAKLEVELFKDLKGHEGWVLDVCFSEDGKFLASAGREGQVRIWEPDGQCLKTIQVSSQGSEAKEVWSIAFSPDGRTLATACEDKTVKLWDLEGNLLHVLEGHKHRVRTVSFSPNEDIIASGGDDSTVILWSADGKLLKRLTDFDGHVNRVRFCKNSFTLATVSDDGTAKLFDLQGHLLKVFKGHTSRVKSLNFSPDGKTLATASWDETIRLWSLDQRIHTVIRHHTDRVLDVNFSQDGERLVTASWDTSACVWDLNGQLLHTLDAHIDKVNGANFSPDGKLIVTVASSKDRTVKFWNADGSLKKSLAGHKSYVRDPSFSHNGQLVLTAGGDKTIRIWTSSGEEYAILGGENGHTAEVRGVSFSPDDNWIVSGDKDGFIKLWTQNGNLVYSFQAHKQEIWNVVFSPSFDSNGQLLIASASDDKTVKIWKFDGRLNWTSSDSPYMILEGHTDRVSDVEFSHCGRIIATGGADKTVRLWSRSGILLATLEGHTDRIMAVDFHKDGELLASAAVDDSVIIWNIAAQVELAKLEETVPNEILSDKSELKTLTRRGYEWVHGFLRYNPTIEDEHRKLYDLYSVSMTTD